MRRAFVLICLCLVCALVAGPVLAQKDGSGERARRARLFIPTLQGGGTYCSTPGLPIDDAIGPTVDTISVPDSFIIDDLDVSLDITHSWVGDLWIDLAGPGGSVRLADRIGDPDQGLGCSDDDIDATVNDEGADGNMEDQCDAIPPAVAGDLVGGDPPDTSLLTLYDGQDSQDDWTLTVTDNAGGDTGALNEWCVIIDADGGGGCNLGVRMRRNRVRAGRIAKLNLNLTHRREATVTVPFFIWIENGAGDIIASTTTSPITMRMGDQISRQVNMMIPAGTPPGSYAVYASVREMRQGQVEARQIIQIR